MKVILLYLDMSLNLLFNVFDKSLNLFLSSTIIKKDKLLFWGPIQVGSHNKQN